MTSRPSVALLGAAAAALVLCTTTALAGSGVGATFNLGKINTVDAQSVLTGNAGSAAQLKLQNTGGGPALALSVNSGVPPLTSSSSKKVVNLNADLLDGVDSSGFWKLQGNAGTTPGTNFLGTTDNKPLELKVNGQRALRLEPTLSGPNVIGGFSGNSVGAGLFAATIAGGGASNAPNAVTGQFGTVGGGSGNSAYVQSTVGGGATNFAGGQAATIGGGYDNVAPGYAATVGGGQGGEAAGEFATVAGGLDNSASGESATVAGGRQNLAFGKVSFVSGFANIAYGDFSFVAGHFAAAQNPGTFVWADDASPPSSDERFHSTGANQFLVRATGGAKFVRGGNTFEPTSAALQAENPSSAGEAAWFRIGSASSTNAVVSLIKQSGGAGPFLKCFDESSGPSFAPKCHIDSNGTFVSGSDFAESLPARGDKARYSPGEVLSIGAGGRVARSQLPRDRAVIGVYSTRPAVLGADKGGITRVGKNDVPVAITGIVPVKVTAQNGPIRPGDLLTSSAEPGRAMNAGPNPAVGTVLGKSLGSLPRGRGVIRMLVMLR